MAIIESARIGALLERDELLEGLRKAFADARPGGAAPSARRRRSRRWQDHGDTGVLRGGRSRRDRVVGRMRSARHSTAARPVSRDRGRRPAGSRRGRCRLWCAHNRDGPARRPRATRPAAAARHRGPALGRRGHARRVARPRSAGRRPRARGRAPTATTSCDRDHPLRVVLGDLATSDGVGRLRSSRLSAAAVARLAEGHDVDPAALCISGPPGNPFYVTEALAAGGDDVPADRPRRRARAASSRLGPHATRSSRRSSIAPPAARCGLCCSRPFVGEASRPIDECLASGGIAHRRWRLAFRHEIARVAVEERCSPPGVWRCTGRPSCAPRRAPRATSDAARLAHHAEQAGDPEAVLRFAPAAAADGAVDRGLPRGGRAVRARPARSDLSAGGRADLLEGRSPTCYLADDQIRGDR